MPPELVAKANVKVVTAVEVDAVAVSLFRHPTSQHDSLSLVVNGTADDRTTMDLYGRAIPSEQRKAHGNVVGMRKNAVGRL